MKVQRETVQQESSCLWAHGPVTPVGASGLCPVCAADEELIEEERQVDRLAEAREALVDSAVLYRDRVSQRRIGLADATGIVDHLLPTIIALIGGEQP